MPGGSGDIQCVGRAPPVPSISVNVSQRPRVCVPEYLYHEVDILQRNFAWSRASTAGKLHLADRRRRFDKQLCDPYGWFLHQFCMWRPDDPLLAEEEEILKRFEEADANNWILALAQQQRTVSTDRVRRCENVTMAIRDALRVIWAQY